MGDAEVDLDAVGVFVAVVLVAAGMPEVVIVLAVFIPAQAGCKPREAKVSLPMTKTACLINSLRDSQTQILRLLLSMAISFLGIDVFSPPGYENTLDETTILRSRMCK